MLFGCKVTNFLANLMSYYLKDGEKKTMKRAADGGSAAHISGDTPAATC